MSQFITILYYLLESLVPKLNVWEHIFLQKLYHEHKGKK